MFCAYAEMVEVRHVISELLRCVPRVKRQGTQSITILEVVNSEEN
jgi:hypothetical protein